MPTQVPVLYSFRRCPYAMRARLAVWAAGIEIELREVALKDKPLAMLAVSPKGTVPVLVLPDGEVIDESLDIAVWALRQNDPLAWLPAEADRADMDGLVSANDGEFKQWLDRYKYAVRYPQNPMAFYREQGERFLRRLESILSQQRFLRGEHASFADVGLFPFVRQFAFVDKTWFDSAPYPALQRWLAYWLASDAFAGAMLKRPVWREQDPATHWRGRL